MPAVQYRPRSNQKFFRNSASARTDTKQTFIRERHFSINDKRVIGGNKNRSKQKKNHPFGWIFLFGDPRGIRTPVTAVKGRCPRPLDDGVIACGTVIYIGYPFRRQQFFFINYDVFFCR